MTRISARHARLKFQLTEIQDWNSHWNLPCNRFYFSAQAEKLLARQKKKTKSNKNKIENGRKNSVTKCRKKLWKRLEKKFRWDNEEMIRNLIQCILSYKPETKFEGKDFDHEKVSWYFQIFLLRDKYDKTLIFCFVWCNLRMLKTP